MQHPWRLLGCGVAGVVAIWLTARLFLPVGLPFLCGALLAALARHPAAFLRERVRLPGWLAALLCITLLCAILLGLLWLLGWLIVTWAEDLTGRLPALLASLRPALTGMHRRLLALAERLPGPLATAAVTWLNRLPAGGSGLAQTLSGALMSLAGQVIAFVPELSLFFVTSLLSAYFFSAEGPGLLETAKKRLPPGWLRRLKVMGSRLKAALGGWCRTQLWLSLVTFGLLVLGLALLGRPQSLATALVIALVDALPVFGAGTVLLPWGAIALLRGDGMTGAGLLLLYGAVALTRAFLEPRFLGRQIGLHPLLTLLSLYGGFRLFGLAGMILTPLGVLLIKQVYDLWTPEPGL